MVGTQLRTRRRLLWALNAALLLGIAAAAWGLSRMPLRIPTDASETRATDPKADADARARIDPLDEYAAIHARPLRKPLYDPKPLVIQEEPKPKPKYTATLVGTMVEPGFTFATFRTRDGAEELVEVGGTIAGAKLLEVSPSEARIEFHGETLPLTVGAEGGD